MLIAEQESVLCIRVGQPLSSTALLFCYINDYIFLLNVVRILICIYYYFYTFRRYIEIVTLPIIHLAVAVCVHVCDESVELRCRQRNVEFLQAIDTPGSSQD